MTTTNPDTLYMLNDGDVFDYRGTRYVVTGFGRTRAKIARVSDGKQFVLAGTATVSLVGHDDDALAAALEAREERAEARAEARQESRPTLRPGTKVRFVNTPQTRKAGLFGQEAVITRTNTKTYTLSNGYRVTPGLIEEIK